MPRFALKFLVLHEPLFFNGNLGTKINVKSKPGLKALYDSDLHGAIVSFQKSVCFIPSANIASCDFVNSGDLEIDFDSDPVQEPVIHQAIIQPTAPKVQAQHHMPMQRAPQAMAPQVAVQQPRTAQVSHPVQDAVNGLKPRSAPKYVAHSPMEIQRANKLAMSGEVIPGAPAPTHADLVALGKLPPAPQPTQYAEAPIAPAPRARRGRPPKVEGQ